MTDPQKFAESTLLLLQQDPRRYVNFGVYWFFVKAVLKKMGYTRDNLHLLGEYMDPEAIARMPEYPGLAEALDASISEYRQNASFNLLRNEVEDPTGGGVFVLKDEDF